MSAQSYLEEVEAAGPGDWRDHVDWEDQHWAAYLTPSQRQSARLVGAGVDEGTTEKILGLPEGQVRKWWDGWEGFRNGVAASHWEIIERQSRPDFSKGLNPKQIEAAALYFEEGRSQKETASAVGVTDRTIRNWLENPVFVRYGHDLMKWRDLTRHRERDEREQRMWDRYSIQVDTALTVIDCYLEEGDLRVAIELLRSFTRRTR